MIKCTNDWHFDGFAMKKVKNTHLPFGGSLKFKLFAKMPFSNSASKFYKCGRSVADQASWKYSELLPESNAPYFHASIKHGTLGASVDAENYPSTWTNHKGTCTLLYGQNPSQEIVTLSNNIRNADQHKECRPTWRRPTNENSEASPYQGSYYTWFIQSIVTFIM